MVASISLRATLTAVSAIIETAPVLASVTSCRTVASLSLASYRTVGHISVISSVSLTVSMCTLLRAASLLLFCFPGSPTVYYGDEAGMEGFEDPFNRQTYPWGHEDRELMDWYRALGAARKRYVALRRGSIRYLCGRGPLLAFVRQEGEERLLCIFNASENPQAMFLEGERQARPVLGRAGVEGAENGFSITVPPQSGVLMELK